MAMPNIKGLDALQRQLKEYQRKAEQLSGTSQVPIEDLLTPHFMQRFTRFSSIDEMFDASGFSTETEEEIEALLQTEGWEAFVAANTQFASWQMMVELAGSEYIDKLWNN